MASPSEYVTAVDDIQRALRPLLKERGYSVRGRTFNRQTEDGLTLVVNIQMGASDPPGTTHIPGLTRNLHGLFTVNLGVYVPEVAKHRGGEAGAWVQEYTCCIRMRLGKACGEAQDLWWKARMGDALVNDLKGRLERAGLPFLDRFSSRDKILAAWHDLVENPGTGSPPRIVLAIILAQRGQLTEAKRLLAQQVLETRNPGHPNYVRALAQKIGVGALDA